MEEYEYNKIEKFDWKETLIVNAIWYPYFICLIYFMVAVLRLINRFDGTPDMQIICAMVCLFAVFNLMRFMGKPTLIFKTKDGKLTIG